VKISMDTETHANDGRVSKDHYEEALTKKVKQLMGPALDPRKRQDKGRFWCFNMQRRRTSAGLRVESPRTE